MLTILHGASAVSIRWECWTSEPSGPILPLRYGTEALNYANPSPESSSECSPPLIQLRTWSEPFWYSWFDLGQNLLEKRFRHGSAERNRVCVCVSLYICMCAHQNFFVYIPSPSKGLLFFEWVQQQVLSLYLFPIKTPESQDTSRFKTFQVWEIYEFMSHSSLVSCVIFDLYFLNRPTMHHPLIFFSYIQVFRYNIFKPTVMYAN